MADAPEPSDVSLSRYRDYLRSVAGARLDPRLQGELDPSDVVQETLLRAHRGIGGFRGKSEPELVAWLRSILVNILRNARRAFGRHRGDGHVTLGGGGDESSFACPRELATRAEDGPEAAATRGEDHGRVTEALARLPEGQRTVVQMKYVQGHSLADICAATGLSKPAVVGLLFRGMKTLRSMMHQPDSAVGQ